MGTNKTILIAKPEVIKFFNCEIKKTYKKTVIIKNIDTKIARFKFESRPAKSAFHVFIMSSKKCNIIKNIAPGMHIRLEVHYKCDGLTEPEETLILRVKNGKSIKIKITAFRDSPVLRVATSIFSSTPKHSTSDSKLNFKDSTSIQTNLFTNDTFDKNMMKSKSVYKMNRNHLSIDCSKCFVGELIIISNFLKNVGGKGRFFLMSEFDWCSMKIEDFTIKNKLIISCFAFWPSYFILQTDEELKLYTYFYPDSYGLQTNQLYIISDNCSIKTIEVIGDGVIFEPQLLRLDKRYVKYLWYETKLKELLTIRYLDLGSGVPDDVLSTTFTISSTCELDLHYRWEINNNFIYPLEYTNLFRRKNFCLAQINIKPIYGIFKPNSITTFKLLVCLTGIVPDQYRSNLQLVIEDLPFAAVPEKYNFSYKESSSRKRLCEHPIDVFFQDIEIRIKCTASNITKLQENLTDRTEFINENDSLGVSPTDTIYQEDIFYNTNIILHDNIQRVSDTISDDFCEFLQGNGICNCSKPSTVNSAILRPSGPVFVGIETEFYLVLRNQTLREVTYWWGNIFGKDRDKLRIKFEQKYNSILPCSSEVIKLSVLPIETGNISSLYATCKFNEKNPIILSFECIVQSLSLSLYFPSTFENNMPFLNQFHIKWNANEYLSKLDSETGKIKLIQDKLSNEKFLHSTTLNDSSIDSIKTKNSENNNSNGYEDEAENTLNDNNSIIDYDYAEQNKNEINTIDKHLIGFDLLKNRWGGEESLDTINIDQNLYLLPYFNIHHNFIEQNFRYLPLVIEIHVTSGKSKTERVYVQNESPISSTFSISIKNFTKRTKLEDNDESESNEVASGNVLFVEPIKGEIEPNKLMHFDITALSNTWGEYTDRITINVNLLPPFVFWVRIINNDLPISYPIYKNSPSTIPKIRFNINKSTPLSGKRKLLIENTSVIPLYLHWHCFSINEYIEKKPFHIILDMFSPFINIHEYLSTNKKFLYEVKKFFSCALNPESSKDNLTIVNTSNDTTNITHSSSSDYSTENKDIESSVLTSNTNKLSSTSGSSLDTSGKVKDTEFQLSLIPYYGKLVNDLFVITPKELFIPPKEKRYIHICVNIDKMKKQYEPLNLYKAYGFIRIPPSFKFTDNMFLRKDGYFLQPTEVLLECDDKKSMLVAKSSKFQRTFEFYTKHFLTCAKSELNVNKKILFKNSSTDVVTIDFEISEPFKIKNVSTQREIFCGKSGSIHPGENVEIELKCRLDEKWIENVRKRDDIEKISNTCIIVTQYLTIINREEFPQCIQLYIKIHFPSLKISTNCLNFGEIFTNDRKTLVFYIQNLSEQSQYYEIKRNDNNIFSIYPNKALLSTQAVKVTNLSEISVSFCSINPGFFKESIGIVSEIDGLVFKCFLEGIVKQRSIKIENL